MTPVDYLILGLVARMEPCTSYDLKREAQRTISHFWSFSHTALYQAPPQLVGMGLLADEQEDGARRRRLYWTTELGRSELLDWLAASSAQPTELRDLSLLKLFLLGPHTAARQAYDIAIEQAEYHTGRLKEYQDLLRSDRIAEIYPPRVAALRFGLLWEQTAADFWSEYAAEEEHRTLSDGAGPAPEPDAN